MLLARWGTMYLVSADLDAGPGARPRLAPVQTAGFCINSDESDTVQIRSVLLAESSGAVGKSVVSLVLWQG